MTISQEALDAACQAAAITVARQDGVVLTPAGYRQGATERPEEHARMLEYMHAALAAASPFMNGWRVKALEWKYDSDLDAYAANTTLGRHLAYCKRGIRYHWCRSGCEGGPFDTLEAAKAAAQTDFEQRIRSALVMEGGGWRDIESAPKDGAQMLLWTSTIGSEDEEYVHAFCDGEHVSCLQLGYWDSDTGGWSGLDKIGAPTHWCPIPSPPMEGKTDV